MSMRIERFCENFCFIAGGLFGEEAEQAGEWNVLDCLRETGSAAREQRTGIETI